MNLIRIAVAALVLSVNILMPSVIDVTHVQGEDKIREYLYSSEADFDSFSSEAIIQYKSIIRDHIKSLKQAFEQKEDASYNVVQGTVLAGFSVACAYNYYKNIIFPYVIAKSIRNGIAHAIAFNKTFITEYPLAAASFAIPLFASLVLGKLSYNYFKKDWNSKKALKVALLLDRTVLARLEKAEQRN